MKSHFWSSILYCSGQTAQKIQNKLEIHINGTIVLEFTQPFTNKNPKVTFTKGSKGGFLSGKSGGFLLLSTLPKNIQFYYLKLSS